ncbi:hypothetical protein CRG98_049159 [Punica granatum]|uniref:Uncharacterized protein n=1 Tax=Punica granatum TaxID=22663 RepID=A0A2I0HFY9_PUNGR|nr:hypothetical protein CRG98_049159 [Punica granatum]
MAYSTLLPFGIKDKIMGDTTLAILRDRGLKG